MTTQLELERVRPVNKFANYRGESNNLLSAYIDLVNESSDPDRIWDEVKQDLIRRSSSSKDLRLTSPEKAIQVAKLAEAVSINKVAVDSGTSCSEVTRYRKIVGVSLVSILQREGIVSSFSPKIDQYKYEQLEALHREADTIIGILNQPEVDFQLQHMPDLKALLGSFAQNSTVEFFLEENRVPYTQQQIPCFNKSVRYYLFGSGNHLQLRTLLRKATLSRWLYRSTDWQLREQGVIDETISGSVAFAYLAPVSKDTQKSAQARHLRFFLDQIIAKEFELAQQDFDSGYKYALDKMFVPINGSGIVKLEDIDIARTFQLFKDVSYCYPALRSFIQEYITRADSLQSLDYFALYMFKDPRYTLGYRKKWISAGIILLENTLLFGYEGVPSWESLTIDRRKKLRQFRELFQNALPEGYIGPQRR